MNFITETPTKLQLLRTTAATLYYNTALQYSHRHTTQAWPQHKNDRTSAI